MKLYRLFPTDLCDVHKDNITLLEYNKFISKPKRNSYMGLYILRLFKATFVRDGTLFWFDMFHVQHRDNVKIPSPLLVSE